MADPKWEDTEPVSFEETEAIEETPLFEETDDIDDSSSSGSLERSAKSIGTGAGIYGGQKVLEKAVDAAGIKSKAASAYDTLLSGVGKLNKDQVTKIRQAGDDYRNVRSLPEVAEEIGELGENIRQQSFLKSKEARDVMSKEGISLSRDEAMAGLVEPLASHTDDIRELSDDPLSNASKKMRETLERNVGLKATEEATEAGLVDALKMKLKDPKLKDTQKVQIKKILDKYSSNIPQELIDEAPELAKKVLPKQESKRFLQKTLEPLSKVDEMKGDRAYDFLERIRDEVDYGPGKGGEYQRLLKDYDQAFRSKIGEKSPKAGKLLEESSEAIGESDTLKKYLSLQKDPRTGEIVSAAPTQNKLKRLFKDVGLNKTEINEVTKILDKYDSADILKEADLSTLKAMIKEKGIDFGGTSITKSGVLGSVTEFLTKIPGVGKWVAALSTAQQGIGTKAQEIGALLPSNMAMKGFKGIGKGIYKALPLAGAGMVYNEARAEGKDIPTALGETALEEVTDIVGPIKEGLRSTIASPKRFEDAEDMQVFEGSKFEEEAKEALSSPQYALESGQSLTEGQQLALDRMERKTQLEAQKQTAKKKTLDNYTFKNKVGRLENDDIDTLQQRILDLDNAAAQVYVDDLEEAKQLGGSERNSKLFNLLQQPGFRAMIRKNQEEPK